MRQLMWIGFLGLIVTVTPAMAETAYVTDQLRIGVRPMPDNNAPPGGVVISGMKLEILKRSEDYVMVRSPEGVEGWIKEIHITKEVPVRVQLDKLSSDHAQLKKEAEEKSAELDNLKQTYQQQMEEVESLRRANQNYQSELAALQGPNDSTWFWVSATFVILLLAAGGFYAGVSWHRQHVMQRLGGLRF